MENNFLNGITNAEVVCIYKNVYNGKTQWIRIQKVYMAQMYSY